MVSYRTNKRRPPPAHSGRSQSWVDTGSHTPDGGRKSIVQEMLSKKPANENLSEVPLMQRMAMAKPLQHYVARSGDRDEAIALAYDSGGYSMKETGEHFGLHYSRVSRNVSVQREAKGKT